MRGYLCLDGISTVQSQSGCSITARSVKSPCASAAEINTTVTRVNLFGIQLSPPLVADVASEEGENPERRVPRPASPCKQAQPM